MSAHMPVIVVHGGADSHALIVHDGVKKSAIEQGVKDAAKAGYKALQSGASAVDAVETAAALLENDPIFNAGHGSCLTIDGNVEMDASIMDGATLRAGGVACIRNVTNPIKVARLVMDKSEHVLFVGEGASRFAADQGIQSVPTDSLISDKAKGRLKKFPGLKLTVKLEFDETKSNKDKNGSHDTIGAVAIDCNGHVAFATSTGGINAKLPGRCGDSSIPGCGGYADDKIGSVSTTGHGESFIKTNAGRLIIFYMEQGCPVQEAVEKGLAYTLERVNGCGGAIAVSQTGDIDVSFNTDGMSWASVKEDVLTYGMYRSEKNKEQL